MAHEAYVIASARMKPQPVNGSVLAAVVGGKAEKYRQRRRGMARALDPVAAIAYQRARVVRTCGRAGGTCEKRRRSSIEIVENYHGRPWHAH